MSPLIQPPKHKGNVLVALLVLVFGLFVQYHNIPIGAALRNVLAFREVVPKSFELNHLARHFANDTTILITAKDTCSQTLDVLEDLRTQVPAETSVRISLPTTLGCNHILDSSMDAIHSLFPDTVVTYRNNFNPFAAWRLDSVHVETKFTMLMHNDVYFIDKGGVLKLYDTMRKKHRDGYSVVVPMIYEREGNVTLSPHAVHSDLHIDPTTKPPTLGHMMDLRKGLMRWSDQMSAGDQAHFLEDHAFMVTTEFIDKLIDPGSAFTMEYIDMYLNMMHEDGIKPHFDPDVRIEFRVRHDDLSLGDIPYMAGRRSEINALGNHRYLEKKWNAQFFFTSAWNYIKFATMRDTHSYSVDEATPDFVEDPGCFKNMLFFTWFEFIGMNHYDGKRLWALEHDLCKKKGDANPARPVNISRRVKSNIEVAPHWQDRDSQQVLPSKTLAQRPFVVKPRMDFKMYPTLVLKAKYAMGETPSDVCGMVVKKKDTGDNDCYIFVPPFEYDRENSWNIWFIEKILSFVKTASRSSIYYCMRNKMQDLTAVSQLIHAGTDREVSSYYCDGVSMDEDYNDQRCSFEIDFDPKDELTKWSGKLHSVKNIVKQLI